MLRFSANLGFLWTELPLPAAIMAAAKAGFDAVECHWPFDVPSSEVAAALTATKYQKPAVLSLMSTCRRVCVNQLR